MLENYDKEKYILFTIKQIEIFKEKLEQSKSSDYAYSEKSQTRSSKQYLLPRENGITVEKEDNNYTELHFHLTEVNDVGRYLETSIVSIKLVDMVVYDYIRKLTTKSQETHQEFFNRFCKNLLRVTEGELMEDVDSSRNVIEFALDEYWHLDEEKNIKRISVTLTSKDLNLNKIKEAEFDLKIPNELNRKEDGEDSDLKWLERRITNLEKNVQMLSDNYATFQIRMVKLLDTMQSKDKLLTDFLKCFK